MNSVRRKRLVVAPVLAALTFAAVAAAQRPPSGPQLPGVGHEAVGIGVGVDELTLIARGWSVKRHLLGTSVFNDKNEKVGSIDDLIIGSDKAASFAIVGTGGFVGLYTHDVAIPFEQLSLTGNRIFLPGATKDILKAMPEFHYAR